MVQQLLENTPEELDQQSLLLSQITDIEMIYLTESRYQYTIFKHFKVINIILDIIVT